MKTLRPDPANPFSSRQTSWSSSGGFFTKPTSMALMVTRSFFCSCTLSSPCSAAAASAGSSAEVSSAAASAPVLQWESDRPATDTEERVYRLACLYLGNAVADGGKIRFPAFGAPGTSIRKAEKGYEVAGFFRIEGKDGRFVDYRYTLTVDEHIVSVLNSSTTRMEAKP